MKYSKCWSEDAVNLYFTTESREKEKDVFTRTHMAIDKIRVDFAKDLPSDQSFINEQQLKDLIINSRPQDRNRIFLIVGETGCGKSELCQWLDYNINDEIHIPIHISRADTKIEDIAKRLSQHLPKDAQEECTSSELVNERSDLLADYLIIHLKLQLNKDKSIRSLSDRKILETLFNDRELKRKIANDIDNYKTGITTQNKERGLLILSKKSFEFHPLVYDKLKDKDGAYLFVNRVITNTLKEYLKVSDLGSKLQRISDHYFELGKRPVLLLEDLTSFTFLAEDLMDYLFDLSKGHFDVVIGWTTGFESGHADFIFKAPDAMTYMKERLRGRFLLSDPQAKSTFFLKDSYKELARMYLNAIKCGNCKICEKDRLKLYPFNSECLDKIYQNLQEGGHPKQTPRIFLEFVLRRVLSQNDVPWKTLSFANTYLKSPASLIGHEYDEFPDFVELVKWYGKQNKDNVEMNSEVFDWFNVKTPIPITEDTLVVPMSQMGVAVTKGNISTDEGKKIKTTEDDVFDFQNWKRIGGKFLTRDSLRKGVILQIKQLGDPCVLKNLKSTYSGNASLFYQRGDSVPVFIEDSGDDTAGVGYKLIIKRTTSPEILETLYYTGKEGGHISEEKLILILEWSQERFNEYNNTLMKNLSKCLGVKVTELALFSKFLLTNLFNNCNKIEVEKIKKDLQFENLPDFSDEYLKSRAQTFSQKLADIQNFFLIFFSIKETLFDYLTFKKNSKLDLNYTLKRVAKIDCRNIPESYKWGNQKSHYPFRELVRVIRDYAYSLSQHDYSRDFNEKIRQLKELKQSIPQNYSTKELVEGIELLKKTCSLMNIPLEEEWVNLFKNTTTKNFDFDLLRNMIDELTSEFFSCEDIFRFVQFLRKYKACTAMDESVLIKTLTKICNTILNKTKNINNFGVYGESSSAKRVKDAYDSLSNLSINK